MSVKLPIIKKWRLCFLDSVPNELRDRCRRDLICFANACNECSTMEVPQCYGLQGEIYNSEYTDGREFITHIVTKARRVSEEAVLRVIAEPGEMAIIVETDRGESYYLIINSYSAVV